MTFIYIILFMYLLFYSTWIFYVAFMNLKEHQKEIEDKIGVLKYGLTPFFILALSLDVLFNFVIGTLYFRELPRELLFTSRCARHLKGSGIQLKRATFVCIYLLDPFDRGHCA